MSVVHTVIKWVKVNRKMAILCYNITRITANYCVKILCNWWRHLVNGNTSNTNIHECQKLFSF